MSALCRGFLGQVYFLFLMCCNCSIYQLLYIQHLIAVVNPALLITCFSYDQSTFLQCYTVALNKRLISGPVLAGSWRQTSHRFLRTARKIHQSQRKCQVTWAMTDSSRGGPFLFLSEYVQSFRDEITLLYSVVYIYYNYT